MGWVDSLQIHARVREVEALQRLIAPGAAAVLFVYHIFFVNLLASFYQCVMTDPGVVPPNWGFYMGDETKRRRLATIVTS
ncbi:unnamed protein product [Symbiodinium sp. CCMP2592]|nr:unnamed protein product [Symbiodinium sp. CCMP2592]